MLLVVLDAWGRPESGILEGNVRWPGSYYECWQANGPKVSGKWCQAYLGKLQVVSIFIIHYVLEFPTGNLLQTAFNYRVNSNKQIFYRIVLSYSHFVFIQLSHTIKASRLAYLGELAFQNLVRKKMCMRLYPSCLLEIDLKLFSNKCPVLSHSATLQQQIL